MAKKSVKVKTKKVVERFGIFGFTLGIFALGFILGLLSAFFVLSGVQNLILNILIDLVLLAPIVGIILCSVQQIKNPKRIGKIGLIINIINLTLIIMLILIGIYVVSHLSAGASL